MRKSWSVFDKEIERIAAEAYKVEEGSTAWHVLCAETEVAIARLDNAIAKAQEDKD